MKYNLQSLYFLYMIEELPTIFLSSGHYSKLFRNDNLFGLTFFITRICYHTYLTYKVRDNYLFLALGIMTLGLHSYWFKNWFTKYFLKTNFFIVLLKKSLCLFIIIFEVMSYIAGFFSHGSSFFCFVQSCIIFPKLFIIFITA